MRKTNLRSEVWTVKCGLCGRRNGEEENMMIGRRGSVGEGRNEELGNLEKNNCRRWWEDGIRRYEEMEN